MAVADGSPNDLLDSGEWNGGKVEWELRRSSLVPNISLCTAIALVAVTNLARSEVVIAESERGWGIIAGHIEAGETPDDTVEREAIEEGGYIVRCCTLFAYKEIRNPIQVERQGRRQYPPIAYMLCYVAVNETDPLGPFTGEEIIGREARSMNDPIVRERLKPEDLVIIRTGLIVACKERGVTYDGTI